SGTQVWGDTLTLEQCDFALTSAVRGVREVAGGIDENDLVGRVKTLEQVTALGGEICAGSVVLGDCAFEVVEGFVALFTATPGAEAPSHDGILKMISRR